MSSFLPNQLLFKVYFLKFTSIQIKFLVSIIILGIFINLASYNRFKPADLTKMTVQEKKQRFKELIIPAVNHVYADLMDRYLVVSDKIRNGINDKQINQLKIEYKAKNNQQLLMALKPHPKSIAIAQAAMESSWATSRFFREAYNIFGVWSFNKNEPRISANEKRKDKTIWVKKYPSIEAAVYDYYRTIGRSVAFEEFRQTRMETNDPYVLVTKLDRYSEKGSIYGQELASIIKYNKFDLYDKYSTELR